MNFPSLCQTQTQVLYAIQQLHNKGKGIELDPMFSRGITYGDGVLTPFPTKRFDIYPICEGVEKASADNLPLKASSVSSMLLDPPWLIHSPGTNDKLANRFGHWRNREQLIEFIKRIMTEGYRVLKQDGLLVFKCQDFIHNRRKFFYVGACAKLRPENRVQSDRRIDLRSRLTDAIAGEGDEKLFEPFSVYVFPGLPEKKSHAQTTDVYYSRQIIRRIQCSFENCVTLNPTTMATVIVIDAVNRTISKKSDQETWDVGSFIWKTINIEQGDDFAEYVSCSVHPTDWTVIAASCGFILRYDGKKFVIPGCALIERIEKVKDFDYEPSNVQHDAADFVISDKEVPGKYAIQWL